MRSTGRTGVAAEHLDPHRIAQEPFDRAAWYIPELEGGPMELLERHDRQLPLKSLYKPVMERSTASAMGVTL